MLEDFCDRVTIPFQDLWVTVLDMGSAWSKSKANLPCCLEVLKLRVYDDFAGKFKLGDLIEGLVTVDYTPSDVVKNRGAVLGQPIEPKVGMHPLGCQMPSLTIA